MNLARLLRFCLWLLLSCAGMAQAATFPTDMCVGDRVGGSPNCTANDVQITRIEITPGSGAPPACVGGETLQLSLDVTVNFGSPERYDIGIFLSQDGKSPKEQSTRTLLGGTGSASCSVSVLPSSTSTPTGTFPNLDPGPHSGNLDTCGDGSKATIGGGTGTATFTINPVTVLCSSLNNTGYLTIPFVVSWDNQASPSGDLCTSNANVYPNTSSKCSSSSGAQGDVAIVSLPSITKTNAITSITPGDSTTYTITIVNTTGITRSTGNSNAIVFKDPAVANLTVQSASCSASVGATCPTETGATLITGMQSGGGVTIPSMVNGSTITFTVTALLTNTPTGTLTNTASVTAGGATRSVSHTDTIVYPSLVHMKSVSIISDPINGSSGPKAIPGAEALYTLTVTNSGLGSVNNNVILITDTIPANTELFVNSLGGSPAGPVTFTQGSVSSNLSFAYTSLGSTTDDVEFANSGGWGYTPVPNGAGYDPAVTQIRFNPKGKMAAWSGSGGQPSFSLGFKVRIK